MALAEERGLSREDAVSILFREAEREFEIEKGDIREVQEALDEELERIEKETKEAIRRERQSSDPTRVESRADQVLHQEEKRVEEIDEKAEEDIEDIERAEETIIPLLHVAESLTDREDRKKGIKRLKKKVRKIDQYNILADLQIEVEDIEKLVNEVEEILESKDFSEKEPEKLAKEVSSAVEKFSQDKNAVERLGFVSLD
ncbi:MAG: hypothetical protein ABEJ36_00080 [Candidatus Nanosalina sp.]